MRSHLLKRLQKPGFFAPDFGLTKSDTARVRHRIAHRRHRYVLGDVYDGLLCVYTIISTLQNFEY
ncbi:MAG: hypothetical protein V7K83_15060 [Nostoc sp.]